MLDDKEALSEASKRSPRNEVARFILSDLDKAITLLKAKNMPTTRINADAAILLKSRVALFEGTWLKYFKNTAFVPNGDGWPGKTKDYNSTYQYPSGNIDSEIDYFLEIAMTASKDIAERYKTDLQKIQAFCSSQLTKMLTLILTCLLKKIYLQSTKFCYGVDTLIT